MKNNTENSSLQPARMLRQAIANHDLDLIESILTEDLEQQNKNNILCQEDAEYTYNSFLAALLSGEENTIEKIKEYIELKKEFDQVALDKNTADAILLILHCPKGEYETSEGFFSSIRDDYLQYLYTTDTLKEFELVLKGQLNEFGYL